MKIKEEVLASVIGMLLTDGGISVISKNKLEVFLTSNSEALRESFKQNLQILFPNLNLKFQTVHGRTVKKIRVCSREVGVEFLKFSTTFRTRPCNTFPVCPKFRGVPERAVPHECNSLNGFPPATLPSFIINGTPAVKRVALRSAMTCDGGIEFHKIVHNGKEYLQRRLLLRCHNPNLLGQWERVFVACGFKITKTINEIRITGKKNNLKSSETK
ncbi:MAG: hypothetical protein HY051_05440 [Candidatus Aenigmarchaeota archaeon]|nr:hypothetical protein [Candidatus Aenigmarchaeota archaeon]